MPHISNRLRRLVPAPHQLVTAILVSASGLGCSKDEGSDPKKNDEAPSEESPNAAPIFDGVSAGYLESDRVRLEWFSAADEKTDSESLVYVAYAGKDGGAVDLRAPIATSLPGALSMVMPSLERADYRFVVRAVDEEGLEDDNTSAVRVSLLDETAPDFAGVVGAIVQGPGQVLVQWKAAGDEQTPSHQIRYRIYASPDPELVFENLVDESAAGATSSEILVDSTEGVLWIGVRAVDAADNESENSKIAGTEIPENEAPTFAGLSAASSVEEAVELSWSPGVDNATASRDMRYAIFWSERSGGQDLSRPSLVTEPGVTSWTVSGLEGGTSYYFVVRALDAAGNTDDNTVQHEAETSPADVEPPVFDGVASLTSASPKTLTLLWDAASDASTASRDMVYEVFASGSAGGQRFATPTATTPRGASEMELVGLSPDTEYFVVVRARDEAGNVDSNVVELSAKTGSLTTDTAPPTLEGVVRAALVPSDPSLLLVSWTGASDVTSPPEELRGHVCIGAQASDCEGDEFFENYNGVSAFGASSYFAKGLAPRTSYFAAIRLEDIAGNMSPQGSVAAGRTATSFSADVKPIIEARCNQCHAYTYGTLVNIFEQDYIDPIYGELFLVDTTSAVESYFIRKLREAGDTLSPFGVDSPADYAGVRMPSDGSDFLEPEVEQVFIDWIDQGAFLN